MLSSSKGYYERKPIFAPAALLSHSLKVLFVVSTTRTFKVATSGFLEDEVVGIPILVSNGLNFCFID
jgi:hypothetical protein